MKTTYRLAAFAAGILAATAGHAQTAAPSINVITWVAPNASGSPNFDAAAQNQFNAVYAGMSSAGTPGTPTYYQAITGPVSYGSNIVTNFNSWLGNANPAPQYAGEFGNRVHFGLMINGNGTQFSISQLTFATDGNGTGDPFDLNFGPGYEYSNGYVGIRYGANGVLGGGDDIFITSGLSNQLVDALIGRGSAVGDEVTCGMGGTTSGPCGAGNQSYIDAEIAALQGIGFTQLTGTYGLLNANGGVISSGSGTVVFAAAGVPEPATWTMMMLGFGLVGATLRRRRVRFAIA